MIKLTRLVPAMLLLAAGSLSARNSEIGQDRKEIRQDRIELAQTQSAFKKLNRAVDFWHDAWLKGDGKKIEQYEQGFCHIIRDDIEASRRLISRHEDELRRSAAEFGQRHDSKAARKDDRADMRDDIADLKRARGLVKVKERLYRTLVRSSAFSNQYRLLGDYLDLLARELGMGRLELAEDIEERHEDLVDRRR